MRLFAGAIFVSLTLVVCGSDILAHDGVENRFEFRQDERVVFVGGSLAERMNLYGGFETKLHLSQGDKNLVIRNFGWPADEVANQQRPNNYTLIDDPLEVFGPELFICFFGFNESFAGDTEAAVSKFKSDYQQWIEKHKKKYSKQDRPARFVLVSPIPVEKTDNRHLAEAAKQNPTLEKYVNAVKELAGELNLPWIDLYGPAQKKFNSNESFDYTINGVHLNEKGDDFLSNQLYEQLVGLDGWSFDGRYASVKKAVNDKSWYHLQDYRMLNGWYVYGGRRTWDKETFPTEYRKIRKMVAVRDQYIWDMAADKPVPNEPDDSKTGEVFIPETMFGTRDDRFRNMREPKTLKYPTPEESIEQMKVPDGMEVQLFVSEREFPEFANPTNITFDNKGRLWVSCMVNYPQWLPGSAKPGDSLLIFEDTDKDGRADKCTTFYDKLICPTGFEIYEDGVLVVDEPRILFLRDTDGDDRADEVTQVLDGIGTDDTHHAMGAWEWSHGGLLHMLEGIALSTTLETPWGPFRVKGPSGSYVLDPKSWRIRYFKTPGYGNPWCLVFDRWGMGMIGDGTSSVQHWASPLSGYNVGPRKTLRTNFNNGGMRPSVGSEFLLSRHLPDEIQGQFIYGCVINMHGMPRFEFGDDGTAGYSGKRIEDLLDSTDNFFRPVDPQVGPDGAVWFGDWCNALIGHMQYSQRDPNRDHEHGRIYRLVNKNKPLIEAELQAEADIKTLLNQLTSYELRTRYRARRELIGRGESDVLKAADAWIAGEATPEMLCEVLWLQESFRKLDPKLIDRLMKSKDFHARAAAVHSVSNEMIRYDAMFDVLKSAIKDEHPRVRLEAIRGLSFVQSLEAAEVALTAVDMPLDYWLEYTLEHTLHALKPFVKDAESLARSSEKGKEYFTDFIASSTPGGRAIRPLKIAQDTEISTRKRKQAMQQLAKISGGNAQRGKDMFEKICATCHMVGDKGINFGPALDGVAFRFKREEIINHILHPNDEIAKGYETVQILTLDGKVLNGFVIEENDQQISLGVATDDGKGKRVDVLKDDIDERKEMKSSSMPEGLVSTIAATEFLDLIEYVGSLYYEKDNWIGTSEQDKGKLRRHNGFKEISRNGMIRLGANFPAHYNGDAHRVLSAVASSKLDFAFHSPEPPIENPFVEVRLAEEAEVRHVWLQNRLNKKFWKRADGLTAWISSDGEQWKEVWKAEKPAGEYRFDLPKGTRAKFVKVGLDRKGIFHLNRITVFGKR